jgi:hypothetical protein
LSYEQYLLEVITGECKQTAEGPGKKAVSGPYRGKAHIAGKEALGPDMGPIAQGGIGLVAPPAG